MMEYTPNEGYVTLIAHHKAHHEEENATIARLSAQVAALTAALEWYAEPANYPGSADARQYQSYVVSGITERARRALGRE